MTNMQNAIQENKIDIEKNVISIQYVKLEKLI